MACPGDTECCFGAQAILKRMEAAARQTQAVRRNDDVDAVHDMRVASRRLRTALELFEDRLPERKARLWGKTIRRVTRALGQARDTDVQIERVRGFLDHLQDRHHQPGIQRLLLRLRQSRQALQADVVGSLDKLDASGVLTEMTDTLGPVVARGQLSHVDLNDARLRARADRGIAERLEQMLAYESCVEQPEQIEQLHAMRIAAKHLRYAMEVFSPLYGEPFGETIQAVRRVQQQLGEIHDGDVWIGFLPDFVEQERQRTVEYFGSARAMSRLVPGIEALRAERKGHREACWRDFVDFWREMRRQDTWVALYRMAARAPEAAVEPPGSAPPAGQEPSA